MKYAITCTPKQKELLELAIKMAISWRKGDIEPICKILFIAYERNYNNLENLQEVKEEIHRLVKSIRDIDKDGKAFGKYEELCSLTFSEGGEAIISEKAAYALENLSEFFLRLIIGQLDKCFDRFHLPFLDYETTQELQWLTTNLHCLCWNLNRSSSNTLSYSNDSEILYDIWHVLGHARYLNFNEEAQELVKYSNMAYSPAHFSKEPLMEIRTIE